VNENECPLCGWSLPALDDETLIDCPFCPVEIGGVTFSSE